jgi:NAD(P)-dependent dehydrogenase (short-subunit alcohol dehydrogenase family)
VNIQDKAFFVTGAASGLGSAVAERLLKEGAYVAFADIDAAAASACAAEHKERAIPVAVDVSDADSVTSAFGELRKRFGHLAGVVNCAGVAPVERIVGRNGPHRLETFAKVVTVNLVGTFNVMRIAAAVMGEQEPEPTGERGVIINTASVAAFEGQIGQSAYAASKGGVAALTLPAARELACLGIRVVCIAPGIFETPMLRGLPQDVQDALGKGVPFPQRLGRPDEFASMVAEIVRNGYVNGEVIRLDGALRMALR